VRSIVVWGVTLVLTACTSAPTPTVPTSTPSPSDLPTPSVAPAISACRVGVEGTEAAVVVVGPTARSDCQLVVSAVPLPSGRTWGAIQDAPPEIPPAAGAACSRTQGQSTIVVLDTQPQEIGRAICSKLGVILQH
jgi:hypothetical protein